MGGRIFRGTVGALATMALAPALAGAATIEVTTTDDELSSDGDCSLREAVQSANENNSVDDCVKGQGAKLDTIKLKAEDYDLTIPTTNEDLNANGDLDYTGGGKLALVGKGPEPSGTQVSGFGTTDRVLDAIDDASSFTVEDLDIFAGDVSGLPSAGLGNDGGGLRAIGGTLTMSRVRVHAGEADSGGGIVFLTSSSVPERIVLRLNRVELESNDAAKGGGLFAQGTATIRRSFIDDNGALEAGGGIVSVVHSMVITDSVLLDNDATASSGLVRGGALYAGGPLEIRRSLVLENRVTEGNEAVDAGAGGVESDAPAKIANTTFYDNSTADSGAAFRGEGVLSHVTFLSNSADGDGDHIHSTGELTLRNSILPGVLGPVDPCLTSAPGQIVSKGFSVSTYDDSDCGFLDSDVFGDVGLVPGGPTDNGGPTETIAIEGSSLAKDLVPIAKCKVAGGEDQRGFERPKGPRCDAGAFERGATP